MTTKPLKTIGILMPNDFPQGPFEAIHDRVVSASARNEKAAKEYYGAENGVAYRFRACCEYSDDFTSFGTANTTFEDRHYEEKALYGFFVSGLSVIESFCYGAYMVGALIEQPAFPLKNDRALKDINPQSTATACRKSKISGESLAGLLAALLIDTSYVEWVAVRNVLAHRLTPGRHFNLGGPGPFALWKPGRDIELDGNTTSQRRNWLAKMLASLIAALEELTVKYL